MMIKFVNKVDMADLEYLLLCDAEVRVVRVTVRALVDDPIHVKIKVVELGHLREMEGKSRAKGQSGRKCIPRAHELSG